MARIKLLAVSSGNVFSSALKNVCVWKGGLVYVGPLRESGEYMVGRPDLIEAESSLKGVDASVGCDDAADEGEDE